MSVGRSPTMPTRRIIERLERLRDHGFITAWRREKQGGRWYWLIDCGSEYGWYSSTQVSGWIDGANAMGAAP